MLRAESAIVISRCWLLAPGCLWLVLATSSAHAACPPGPGSSVSVSYHDTGQTDKVEVFDGQVPQDTDGRTRGITATVEFGGAPAPPSPWTATGVIRAFSDTSGFAETLLKSSEISDRDRNNYLEVIDRNAERLANLVADLLYRLADPRSDGATA